MQMLRNIQRDFGTLKGLDLPLDFLSTYVFWLSKEEEKIKDDSILVEKNQKFKHADFSVRLLFIFVM